MEESEQKNYTVRDVSVSWLESLRGACLSSGQAFDLTEDDLADLMEAQGWKCHYSGQDIEHPRISRKTPESGRLTPIETELGYIRGNVRYCSRTIHAMKAGMSEAEFLSVCSEVSSRAGGAQ
jgi:hypothetical protein